MFYIPGEAKVMSTPVTSKRPEEREFVVHSGASMHMMSKKELSSVEMGTVERSRNPTVVLTANGEVHTHEKAQGVRSWLESVRNRATTRGNTCCPVAMQALQRPRILTWVGQPSRATIDPKWEKHYLQDRQFRISCRCRVICQFWMQFVFYNATTRIVGTRGTPSLWEQGCVKLIFRFSIGVKGRTSHQETGAGIRGMREVNPETITGTLSWYKILPLNGFSLILQTKSSHETEKAY